MGMLTCIHGTQCFFLLPAILAREGIKGITLKIKLFILCEITRNTINVIRQNCK